LIVGVMPDGFIFPINHAFWIPLRADASRYERRQGPDIRVFGRLAAGATFESAQAELTAINQRSAALPAERGTSLQARQTQDQLRPRILPYTYPFFDINEPGG
jgi:putative ABC transport system permease protein